MKKKTNKDIKENIEKQLKKAMVLFKNLKNL